MKMITRVFNVFVAALLLAYIGLQVKPAYAQQSWMISGSTGVPGTTLSYFDGTAQTATADGNGNYSFSVSDGFAGTVTPSKTGYTVVFTPASIDYTSTPVTSNQTNQNYVPDTSWWTVSGNAGIAGATLNYNDGSPESVMADGNGDYTLLVPDSFAGTITPLLVGYTFTPGSIDYASTPVTANFTGQDYIAAPITYTISGNAGVAGATLSYTDGTAKTATADSNGDYSFSVSDGFAGTVTPSLVGYTFSPASKDYASAPVSVNLTGENYTATAITFTISGNAGWDNAKMNYVDGTPKTVISDNGGYYSLTVSYGWSGTITPSRPSGIYVHIFTPASKSYSNVIANQTNQNYIGTRTWVISSTLAPGGDLRDSTPTYQWVKVAPATQYEYRLFKAGVLIYAKIAPSTVCSGTICSSTPSTVLDDGSYKWQVRVMAEGVWKDFSSVQHFTVTTSPIIQQPFGYVVDTTPTYIWGRVIGATQYEYKLWKNTALVYTKVVPSTACVNASCSSTPTTVLGYNTYKWQVRAKIGGVWKWFSEKSFTVTKPMANGDFELGKVGWDEDSTHGWQLITTSLPGLRPHSGIRAVWLGGDYSDLSSITQKVVVPFGTPHLTFWYWIASADRYCGHAYDYARVMIGNQIVEEYHLCTATNTGKWKRRSIDLSGSVGESVSLKILTQTNWHFNSNFFIDDVSFQAHASSGMVESGSPDLDPLTIQDKARIFQSTLQPQ